MSQFDEGNALLDALLFILANSVYLALDLILLSEPLTVFGAPQGLADGAVQLVLISLIDVLLQHFIASLESREMLSMILGRPLMLFAQMVLHPLTNFIREAKRLEDFLKKHLNLGFRVVQLRPTHGLKIPFIPLRTTAGGIAAMVVIEKLDRAIGKFLSFLLGSDRTTARSRGGRAVVGQDHSSATNQPHVRPLTLDHPFPAPPTKDVLHSLPDFMTDQLGMKLRITPMQLAIKIKIPVVKRITQ